MDCKVSQIPHDLTLPQVGQMDSTVPQSTRGNIPPQNTSQGTLLHRVSFSNDSSGQHTPVERTPGHIPAPSRLFKRGLGATHPHRTNSRAHSCTEPFREGEKRSAGSHNLAHRLQPRRCVGSEGASCSAPGSCPHYHPKCPPLTFDVKSITPNVQVTSHFTRAKHSPA